MLITPSPLNRTTPIILINTADLIQSSWSVTIWVLIGPLIPDVQQHIGLKGRGEGGITRLVALCVCVCVCVCVMPGG